MKKNIMKKIILSLVLLIPINVTACGEKQKEITLLTDVKNEARVDDGNTSKISKVKELDLGQGRYYPICWRNDENIIATESGKRNNEFNEFQKVYTDDINVYNININTSQITKLTTIKDARCLVVNLSSGKETENKGFLYTKENKLCMYNVKDNSTKVLYDLSDLIKASRERKGGKIKTDEQLVEEIASGFVLGNDKCVYIISKAKEIGKLIVIDLETGKTNKKEFASEHLSNIATSSEWFSCAYNRNKDTFYLSSFLYPVFYEIKFNDSKGFKKIVTAGGRIGDISADGNELYFCKVYGKDKSQIIKYNIEKDKAYELLNVKKKGIEKNEISTPLSINCIGNKNIVSYLIQNIQFDSWSKNVLKDEDHVYIAEVNNNTIKNSKTLPIEQTENKNSVSAALFNSKGNKLIYTNVYLDIKDNKFKVNNIKNYVYEVK